MKKIVLILGLLFSTQLAFTQAPEKINYQAVARDASGNPLVNQTLNVTYQIRQSSPTGTSVYTETHSGISTNQFGLFTAEIGGGTPSVGTFAGINWGAGLYYLYVEVNGDPMGSSQLLSVPYALYAKQSANGPQGLPGRNSISIVTPEPAGANCQNGGNKIDVGTDDNGDNILQALEIDFTYFVCNGDSGATGLGVNWLGNGTTFPPTPNNENDAFYHSTHNTSYIYNGSNWDTLVSGNVGSAGFWSQSGNTIYNNNNSNSGNVSIGTTLSLSKLTVGSIDTTVATFVGSNTNVAVITVANANANGTSGIAFVNGNNSNAFMAYSPSNKTLSIVNGVTDGHLYLNSDSSIIHQSLVIANQAQKIANQAQTSIYNNTDTIYSYSTNGPIINANSGSFLTDSLYVLGNNFLNANWILANDGTGQAKWTDPNTLGLGNDNQDLSLTGNSLSLTNDPTPVDLTPYLDNTDAQTLSINANTLAISNGNSVTLPTSPTYTAGTGINLTGNVITNTAPDQTVVLNNGTGINVTGTYPNFTINNTSPASGINITGGGITSVSGTSPNFTISTPAQTLTYTAPNLTLSNGGGTVTIPPSPWGKTGTTIHELNAGDNVGIGITNAEGSLHVRSTSTQLKLGHPNQPTAEWTYGVNASGLLSVINENYGTPVTVMSMTNLGLVGVGTTAPTANLHLDGTLRLNNLGGSTPAIGSVLTSIDAQGNAEWQPPIITTTYWSPNGTDIYNNNIGNIGIGTATPQSKLEVRSNASSVTDALFLSNTNNGDGYGTKIAFRSQFISTPWTQAEIHGITSNSITQGSLVFNVMNNRSSNILIEAMRINGDGNVGIGTTTPGLITGASKYLSIMNTGPYIVGSITSLELGGNTSGGNAPASYIDFINNTSTPSNIARITARTSGTSTLEGQLTFSTNDGTLSERMRINQSGFVGIGTTNPGTSLEVNGAVTYTPTTAAAGSNASYALTVGDRSYIRVTTTFGGATLGSISNGLKPGQLLIIENVGGYLFTINDGAANLNIAGNALLYANDTITLIWTGSRWLEISRSDN